jgi:hypothetical protein
MKKGLVIVALVLVLSTSIIAGTLAMYTTSIDNLATGSVVAKEFVLLENGTDSFTENVKIAPSETVNWQFSVKNYDGSVVSETAMGLDFNIDVKAADGKAMIDPLVVTVKDQNGNVVGTRTGSGPIQYNSSFALDSNGQQKTYTVSVNWPSNDAVDINYAGASYGAAVSVSVTGTQE